MTGKSILRRRLRIAGLVQGVGFRPAVYRIASRLGLSGFVLNDAAGVCIELEGREEALAGFAGALRAECPPLARIDSITESEAAPSGEAGFRILESRGGRVSTAITPDAATCGACMQELFTPGNRRYRYAFTNCTHCGPRFTITRRLPYDRPQTSMAPFQMCPPCEAEYRDPLDRRFHAQPNACPACGPKLELWSPAGRAIACRDVIEEALARIRAGQILAIKGIGGFHLACDARNPEAVARLRRRKRRSEKPLAVMVASLASARRWARISALEAQTLSGRERPIVLLAKTPEAEAQMPGIAPGLSEIGILLPYTPLHLLLFHEAAGRPAGVGWLEHPVELALVMTSANPGGEPLVISNGEALQRLGGLADCLLVHDRGILVRCDDSVVRCIAGAPRLARRARGFTPEAIPLALASPPVLAAGPGLKAAACLTRGAEAFLSQHAGDLSGAAACRALEQAILHLEQILEIRPALLAHDLHPDFFSTRLALRLAAERGLPCFSVQHHRAHVAAVMAEHGLSGPVRGLALDGSGLGIDGQSWGGELLTLQDTGFARDAHLMALPLPGGDRASREPWRMAAAALWAAGRADEIPARFPGMPGAGSLARLIESPGLTGSTTSMGRWLDAAAALLGLCLRQQDEATAAMRLESAASGRSPALRGSPWEITPEGVLSLLPLLMEIADRPKDPGSVAQAAADLHEGVARALACWILETGPASLPLCLAGGCFINRRLTERLVELLEARGVKPLLARRSPPGDGGIALGQAWCAILARRAAGRDDPGPGDLIAMTPPRPSLRTS